MQPADIIWFGFDICDGLLGDSIAINDANIIEVCKVILSWPKVDKKGWWMQSD